MEKSILSEISRLRQMTTAELQREWVGVFGSPPTSPNKQHLWRKLAWELQARARGGLSDAARARLKELGHEAWDRSTSRRRGAHGAEPVAPAKPAPKVVTRIRDPRRVLPGTVLTRTYHGREIRVVALEKGFEWDGRVYSSLSAVARAVTGAKWSGNLFFGLRERKRRS